MTAGGGLVELRPAIGDRLKAALPRYWPALGELLDVSLGVERPEVLLPLASCQAAGGEPAQAVPAAAAILAAEVSLLMFDDVYDHDRVHATFRQLGAERTCNFASVFQTLSFRVLAQAPWSDPIRKRVEEAVIDGFLEVAAGQDRDLAGQLPDLDAYWSVAERKTGAAYGCAMAAGALVATDDPVRVGALKRFGYHMGLAVQVINDLRGTWFPGAAASDLERGKLTLPLVYAVGAHHPDGHPDRALLVSIVKEGQIARHHQAIRQALDRLDARAFVVWAALQHRDKALAALAPIQVGPGKVFLDDFFTGFFGNIDELLAGSGAPSAQGTAEAREIVGRDAPPSVVVSPPGKPSYRSSALSLRRAFREGSS